MACPDSLNGQHECDEAEVESVTPIETTLVFFCTNCGSEGRMVVRNNKIVWETPPDVDDEDADDCDEDYDEDLLDDDD